LIVGAILLILFLIANSQQFREAGFVFLALAIGAFVMYRSKVVKPIGIDEFGKDIGIGFIVGAGLIFANVLGFFSLALPPIINVFSTNIGRLLVIAVIAPVVEEILFRGAVMRFLSARTNNTAGLVLQALFFASFHLSVYAGFFLEEFALELLFVVGGAFASAFVFGVVAGLITRRTNNLLPAIIAHASINLWLIQGLLVIV